MFSRPKSLNLGSTIPNPIVFATFNPSNRTRSQIQTTEVPHLALSFVGSESSDEMDDDPLEKQKPAGMATFEEPHGV